MSNIFADLKTTYQNIISSTDIVSQAARIANASISESEQMEEDILSSGAMRGEFRIMLLITTCKKFGGRKLSPVLR